MNDQIKHLFDDVYYILGKAGEGFFKDGSPNIPFIVYSIGRALSKITLIQEKLKSKCDEEAAK